MSKSTFTLGNLSELTLTDGKSRQMRKVHGPWKDSPKAFIRHRIPIPGAGASRDEFVHEMIESVTERIRKDAAEQQVRADPGAIGPRLASCIC